VGSIDAQIKAGDMLNQADSVIPTDFQKALSFYKLAAKGGSEIGAYKAGNILKDSQKIEEAIEYITKASDKNHIPAKKALVNIYEKDPEDKNDLIILLKEIAKDYEQKAQREQSDSDKKENLKNALIYYQKAAKLKDIESIDAVSKIQKELKEIK
jgi:TPR repeat protein